MRSRPFALLAITGALFAAGGCPPVDGARAARQPQQTIIAVDLSGSQTSATLRASRAFVEKTIDDLSYGDHFALLEMNRTGVRGNLQRFADTVPDLPDSSFIRAADKNTLKGKQSAFRTLMPMVFNPALAGKIPRTDIFATLFTAGEYMRDARGRPTTIILLSDMLQSANGIEMEGLARMPQAGWIMQQKGLGTIPDLKGACIIVVGADASTPAGVTIRGFWRDYFLAAGANFQVRNYALLSNSPQNMGCDQHAAAPADSGSSA